MFRLSWEIVLESALVFKTSTASRALRFAPAPSSRETEADDGRAFKRIRKGLAY